MITNETRAKLISDSYSPRGDYTTDANAVAELRAFVRARGKEFYFIRALERTDGYGVYKNSDRSVENGWNAIDATPAQQCAAFDAVFKDELEKL